MVQMKELLSSVILKPIVICPTRKLATALDRCCVECQISVSRRFDEYPTSEDLVRSVRIHAPNVVFIDLHNTSAATELVNTIRSEAPNMPIVAINELCDSDVLLHAVRLGAQDFLSVSSCSSARECFARIQSRLANASPLMRATDRLFCFLPSKPGVGASTIAVQVALAAAKAGSERVFLGDFDLGCGSISFLLRSQTDYSIQDAAERVFELDENLWPQIVYKKGNLDVANAGPLRLKQTIEARHTRQLVDYLRRSYNMVIADLSGVMDGHSLELMQEAKQIFIVTAPDLAALHLARRKVQFLEERQLADKVAVLFNRASRSQVFTPKELQDSIGAPVWMSFPEDTKTVNESVTAASEVNAASEFARQIRALADNLTSRKGPQAAAKKSRFIDCFSVLPGRWRFES